ncbi:MAG: TolC family protein [Chitinophagales bacterium]
MSVLKNSIALCVLVFIAVLAVAQEYPEQKDIQTFSLKEAQEYALKHSNLMKNAELDYQISKKQTLEVITEGLPKILGEFNYQNNFNLPETVIPAGAFPGLDEEFVTFFGVQHQATADISVNQLIVDGRYFIGLKANKAILSVADGQVQLKEIDLKNTIASTYYSTLVAIESKALLDSNFQTLEQLLAETEELYKEGFSEELDVDRLRLNLANLESAKTKADLQAQLSLNVLKYQMGMELNSEIELTDNLEDLLSETEAVEINAPFDHTQRVEHNLLQTQHELRGYEAKSIRAGYFPSVYFFGGYSYFNQRSSFEEIYQEDWFESGFYGLNIKVPIFDSYKRGAQVQQKKLDQLKIKNNLENFEQQAKLEVKQARTNYSNALNEYNNQTQNLELANKIYNKVQEKYKEGVSSSMELANSETDLTDTQTNYINALYNLLLRKTELDKALGEL